MLVGIVLLYGAWRGWSSGILVQLSGLAGIVAGLWVASHFSAQVGGWLGLEGTSREVLFVVVGLLVLVGVIILMRVLSKILSVGGLSVGIKLLGCVLSVIKTGVLLSLLLLAFVHVNDSFHFVDSPTLAGSNCYAPLLKVGRYVWGLAGG